MCILLQTATVMNRRENSIRTSKKPEKNQHKHQKTVIAGDFKPTTIIGSSIILDKICNDNSSDNSVVLNV